MISGLPSGLQAFLARIGVNLGKAGGEVGVAERGLNTEGKDPKALQKGQAIADGSLLTGLGFSPEDRRSLKNAAERANIDRFMQDPATTPEGALLKGTKEGGEEGRLRQELRDQVERESAREVRDLRDELRREDRADRSEDVRRELQETKERRDRDEIREAKEQEHERQRDRDDQDDDRPGAAWVQEELEREEEERKRHGLRESDALGDAYRCHGEIEDGSRCLRKVMSGTPYCREHAGRFGAP